MITEICLDMDDVLNSFTLPVMKSLTGLDIGPFDYHRYPVEAGYDYCKAINMLGMPFPHTLASVWTAFPALVMEFLTAPKSKECDKLVEWAIEQVGQSRVFILTKPIPNPLCYHYKATWIQQHLPSCLHDRMVTHPEKYLLGAEHRLLIDDSFHNIAKWNGPRICLKRPWNDSPYTVEDIIKNDSSTIFAIS